MTLHSRARRQQGERNPAFVEQAAAPEVEQLHCQIPGELHLRLRVRAAERKCTITSLVIQALENYFSEQR